MYFVGFITPCMILLVQHAAYVYAGKAGACMIGRPLQAIFNGGLFKGTVSGYTFDDGDAW